MSGGGETCVVNDSALLFKINKGYSGQIAEYAKCEGKTIQTTTNVQMKSAPMSTRKKFMHCVTKSGNRNDIFP